MFQELSANSFAYNSEFYDAELEELLLKIVNCYNLLVKEHSALPNDENKIRDVLLLGYLRNNSVRQKLDLLDYLFDREVPEDKSVGRTDIKIQTLNTFQDTDAYYILECKRIDDINIKGVTGLNAKYLQNGIARFISETYSSHYKSNGMIGFVVKKLNIDDNVTALNSLFDIQSIGVNAITPLTKRGGVFEFLYYSRHQDTSKKDVLIYHLMLDLSQNMESEP